MYGSVSSKRSRVNGIFSIMNDSSPCRDLYVEPDHQPATVLDKDQLKIGTWKVRTLYEKGQFTNVQLEMKRLDIDVLGLCEVQWKGPGKITSNDYTFTYSGRNEHKNGVGLMMKNDIAKVVSGYWSVSERVMIVRIKRKPFDLSIVQVYAPTSDRSDEKVDEFYEQLESAKKQSRSQDIVIVMGDLNDKVGKQRFQDTVGPHGLGEKNERGENCIDWCLMHGHVILNTWFQHLPRRLWT